MATIKDVAKLSEVSTATVSFVLNGRAKEKNITKLTQDKVIAAARKLNYQPNIMARRLKSSGTKEFSLGIFWAFDNRAYALARFLMGIQQEFLRKDYPINLTITPFENDKLSSKKELFDYSSFNAVVIASTSKKDMEYLQTHHPAVPAVLFNRTLDNYYSVGIDNEEAGSNAALNFIDKEIKSIGAVVPSRSYLAMNLRYQGFIDTCTKYNITMKPEHIIKAEHSIEGGLAAAEKLLSLPEHPKAIYCGSDDIARGLVHGLHQKGLQIPDDIEIIAIGSNNIEYSMTNDPAILYIDIPIEKMAIETLKLIYRILEGIEKGPRNIIVETELLKQK